MPEAVLQAERLTKQFGAHTAVSDVSFAVAPGELLSIIGPNGAGKTTLFNLLTKDLTPSAGRIVLEGQDVTALKPHRISRLGVGRSYQITSVFQNLTVAENVWVAAYRHRHGGRFDFLRRRRAYAQLDPVVGRILENAGLESYAGMRASELSYGHQRMLEIAITLATEPRLILLDEPTSGLSQEDTRQVGEMVRRLAEQHTVVMIEHKMSVVMSISHRLIVMNFGEVIAEGEPEDVARNPEVRKAYFGTAAGV